jgi:hypothetical protein
MEKSIHFENPVILPIAINVVMIALEKVQKTYKEKQQSFHFKEINDYDLLEKKIEVIIGDSHSYVSAFGIIIILRIRMISKGLPMTIQIVPSMRVCIENKKLKEETYKVDMDEIVKRIEDMIKFVGMSCDNI